MDKNKYIQQKNTSLTDDETVKLANWNPYDQNASSGFFYMEWMFGLKEGFDIVIGNPPYGSIFSETEKKLFRLKYSKVHVRVQDSFNYFIAKSFIDLKIGGIVSFIVPNNLLFQIEYEKTRKLIVDDNNLLITINLGDNVFESADVPSCIFICKKIFSEDYNYKFSDLRYYSKTDVQLNFSNNLKLYSKKNLISLPSLVFISDRDYNHINNKIMTNSVQVNDIASDVSYGVGTGGDKIFRINYSFAHDKNLEMELIYKCLVGGDISRYTFKNENYKIIYTTKNIDISKYSNIYNYLLQFETKLSDKRETKKGTLPWWCLHWARKKELFLGDKIILRQTGDSIKATYDNDNYFVLDSVMVIKLNIDSGFTYKYILALLNSKLINYFYTNLTQEKGRAFAQVKPQNIRKLPILEISQSQQQPFIEIVDLVIEKKKLGENTQELENKIDQMVYELYELTPEEIDIVEKNITN